MGRIAQALTSSLSLAIIEPLSYGRPESKSSKLKNANWDFSYVKQEEATAVWILSLLFIQKAKPHTKVIFFYNQLVKRCECVCVWMDLEQRKESASHFFFVRFGKGGCVQYTFFIIIKGKPPEAFLFNYRCV